MTMNHLGLTTRTSFLATVLKPTIGPNSAKAIKPVKRLSLIEDIKKFYFIYTFSISGLPKKPVGKNISTTTKTVNAAMSLYSIEI